MMELSGTEEWGTRETLAAAPASVGMGRRALLYHETPAAHLSYEGRPQYRESGLYASGHGDYSTRSRQSSGPRSMTQEELAERHRKRLSALQEPVTAKIREPLEVASARAEWEKQKRIERAEMQKREAERLAQVQERERKGPSVDKKEVLKSTDEWRRSIASGLDRVTGPTVPVNAARPAPGGDRRMSHRASAYLAN
jgi:Mg-chelatase subunit ChlI